MKKLPENVDSNTLCVIALGSDLAGAYPDSLRLLNAAVVALEDRGFTILAQSAWWRSAAWPDPAEPPYLNGVLLVEPSQGPRKMLAKLHAVERDFGRERHVQNAPRTLDLDLIAHGRSILDDPSLTLPHPRAHERLFVMGPLVEIAPSWRHPVSNVAAPDLALAATVGLDAAPLR